MTCAEVCAAGPGAGALLNCGEFLKMVEILSGQAVTRRTLQFYSSPQHRLMPLPVYARRHTAYYFHPEHTRRMAVIMHLRNRYFLPINVLRRVLSELAPDHYELVMRDAFTAEDLTRIGALDNRWPLMREAIYGRVLRLLSITEAFEPSGRPRRADSNGTRAAIERFRAWARSKAGAGIASTGAEIGARKLVRRSQTISGSRVASPEQTRGANAILTCQDTISR